MRILTRYILKEVASHSLLGLLIFTLVIYIRYLGNVLELVVRHDLNTSSVFTLFALPIPGILVLTIPMAVVVGTLIGLGRMAADGEVIAARASGVGISQFVRPVMLYGMLGWGVASWMGLFLAPRAARKLAHMEAELRASQAPYEIRPRVFIEQFPDFLLYLQDVRGARSQWRGVFIADNTQHAAPKVTLAKTGVVVNPGHGQDLTLHLEDGTEHELDPKHPDQYSVTSFRTTDLPLKTGQPPPASERRTPPLLSLSTLLSTAAGNAPASDPDRRAALVELHYRFALPAASLVLALVGIPLGLYTRKGGKAAGVVMAVLLVFLYYIAMAFGRSFALQGRLNAALGLWLANVIFCAAGIYMVARTRSVRTRIQDLQDWAAELVQRVLKALQNRRERSNLDTALLKPHFHPATSRFFQILDIYVIREWFFYFVLMVFTFTGVYFIFDFFQLLGDIIRNHVRPLVVFDYYRYLAPQVFFFPAIPLGALVATLVSFGLLNKTNQITAIKSAGVSLYRAAVPVFLAAALLSAGLFLLEDNYLPALNQRQDAYRNQIKGKPAQTYFRPDAQWIFGASSRIFNYRFFDPDRELFANLQVFEFDKNFAMTRRIYAARAFWEPHIRGWVMENGWMRNLQGDRVTQYQRFSVATFDEIREEPQYFAREVRTSEQMGAWELRRYIDELAQSGFDVVRLYVQFYRKFSFPLVAFIVTLIAFPFALTGASKGTVSGVALSIGIAIVYWSTSSLFEEMGNLHQLPPAIAAWSPDILFGLGGAYLLLRIRT